MHFWLSTIGHYLVTRALNRALNGVFGGDALGTESEKKRALLGHAYPELHGASVFPSSSLF